jgi:acyl-CoA thioester hydrolase
MGVVMAPVHESLFRIRHYECDAYGHVNNANYLRYMQEAAMRASAEVGWDVARYTGIGQHWLVHDTTIEYLAPLRYGDTVRVKTWVLDFQRVRSRRAYELYEAGEGQLCARATTEWVYLNTQSGRPARIPPTMIADFLPDGAAPAAPRTPFPAQPPPPPGVFTMPRKVMWQEVDSANHVNNAVYLAYLSDCGFEVAEAYGWSAARMQAAGFGILVRKYRVEYVEPAVLGDHLEVATYVYDLRRATASRVFTIRRATDGALLVRADALYVWVDLQSGQPRRIPPEFIGAFSANIVS